MITQSTERAVQRLDGLAAGSIEIGPVDGGFEASLPGARLQIEGISYPVYGMGDDLDAAIHDMWNKIVDMGRADYVVVSTDEEPRRYKWNGETWKHHAKL